MRLKNTFITQEVDGEQIMVGTGESSFAGLVRSNRTAAFIVNQLKHETTEQEIVNALLEKYEVERCIVERDVHGIIEKLRSIGAIHE